MIETTQTGTSRKKIHPLDDLAELIAIQRFEGQRVVLCHGVFDLLHIGHIRHLEHAKRLGDCLVVTVTPDRYVNKGPHRPAFHETLRAEAVAALDCVDYVAINSWPTAVRTIHLLRPAFYVKGADYRAAEKDRTGGIVEEDAAVRAVGGQLVFTDDITFSSSALLNRYHSAFPKHVREYLAAFSARYQTADILRYLDDARSLNVLVVGEAIIDAYQYCEAIGKSSKEPMLALKRLHHEQFAGGILAVGNHVANFCDRVSLLTVLGEEASQETFIRDKLRSNIVPIFFYQPGAPTIVKQRFIEEYTFNKLLEIYEMHDEPLPADTHRQLCTVLQDILPRYDIVLVVDFGHGMLRPEAIEILCQQAPFLAVNAQSNAGNLGYHTISKYPRADYISLAENELRLEARDRRGNVRPIIREVAERLHCQRLVVTRSRYGCVGYSPDEGFIEVPAFAGHVVDRVGAGDAFLSLTALCAVQQAPMEVLGFIGNAVGAQAVGTVGHRTSVERIPLVKHITSLLK
jgi:rfaE bifunctional protein nucleotidyltransferase chain/domain